MIEVWKNILGYEAYQISNFGNVRRNSRQVKSSIGRGGFKTMPARRVATSDNGKGYKLLSTSINTKRKNLYIHRLVAIHFIPNPKNHPEVNHIDCDKSNNHFSNLEWVDLAGNRAHAVKNNLVPFGENASNSKLTESQVWEILLKAKEVPNLNRTRLAIEYNVVDTVICRIISGKRWKRTYERFHNTNQKHP